MEEENIEFQDYLNELYKGNSWTKEQLADILTYYSKNWLIKYENDMIYIYDNKNNLLFTYENFEQFKKEIWEN